MLKTLAAHFSAYRQEILTFQLEREKHSRFSHIAYASYVVKTELFFTRKYPLRGYFLGVLTHTTAWDRLWGGEQTFWFEILSALPCLVAV